MKSEIPPTPNWKSLLWPSCPHCGAYYETQAKRNASDPGSLQSFACGSNRDPLTGQMYHSDSCTTNAITKLRAENETLRIRDRQNESLLTSIAQNGADYEGHSAKHWHEKYTMASIDLEYEKKQRGKLIADILSTIGY